MYTFSFSFSSMKYATASQNHLADSVPLFQKYASVCVDITRSNFEVTHRTVSDKDIQRKLQDSEDSGQRQHVNATGVTKRSITGDLCPL